MTPAEFEAVRERAAFKAMAARAFHLRPAEAAALGLLFSRAGRACSYEQIASDWSAHGLCNGSDQGVRKRVERVRRKLEDIGLPAVIQTVARGYAVAPGHARQIEAAPRWASGVAA